MQTHPLVTVHDKSWQKLRRPHRTNWRWLGTGLCFKHIGLYRAFIVDGVRWIKIPLSAGVNATKAGGGKSTALFGEYQSVEKGYND